MLPELLLLELRLESSKTVVGLEWWLYLNRGRKGLLGSCDLGGTIVDGAGKDRMKWKEPFLKVVFHNVSTFNGIFSVFTVARFSSRNQTNKPIPSTRLRSRPSRSRLRCWP